MNNLSVSSLCHMEKLFWPKLFRGNCCIDENWCFSTLRKNRRLALLKKAICGKNVFRYLSLDIICSSETVVFLELLGKCSLLGTDDLHRQIGQHICAPNGSYCYLLYGCVSHALGITKFSNLIGWHWYWPRSRFSHLDQHVDWLHFAVETLQTKAQKY